MNTTTSQKVIPFCPSDAVGPIGIFHLLRLWYKAFLHQCGRLADGYDLFFSERFDKDTLDGLGISPDDFMAFMEGKPTYPQFEDWVKQHTGPELARLRQAHNERILELLLSEEEVAVARQAVNREEKNCWTRCAATYITLQDAAAIHKQFN